MNNSPLQGGTYVTVMNVEQEQLSNWFQGSGNSCTTYSHNWHFINKF
jgi:hypothetical protein